MAEPQPDSRPREHRPATKAVALADYLSDTTPVRWAISGMAVAESVTAVVGPPESMKTFLLLQACLAAAGSGDLLGIRPEPMPALYVSNEKSRATVRDRFRAMTAAAWPTEPVLILHRAGVTFSQGWDVVRQTLDELQRPALVALDTLASLSPAGFRENEAPDMSVALAAMRGIVTDYHATVLLAHHPAGARREGTGGTTLRGHTSLFGELDGVLSMRRPRREDARGTLTCDPKDGDRAVLSWEWDRETFRLRSSDIAPLDVGTIAELVAAMGDPDGPAILAAFPGQPERTVQARIADAVKAEAIWHVGLRGAWRYVAENPALAGGSK